MNWPIALPVALISSLIRLCSSSGILQVMPFSSILLSLLFIGFPLWVAQAYSKPSITNTNEHSGKKAFTYVTANNAGKTLETQKSPALQKAGLGSCQALFSYLGSSGTYSAMSSSLQSKDLHSLSSVCVVTGRLDWSLCTVAWLMPKVTLKV